MGRIDVEVSEAAATRQARRKVAVDGTNFQAGTVSVLEVTTGGSLLMKPKGIPRRDWLVGSGAALLTLAASPKTGAAPAQPQVQKSSDEEDAYRARRMQWWHEARFGMFIHWGLYSVLGRHEWVMENEGIPVTDYKPLANPFHPQPSAARAWAKLAKQAGQKYMVMTSKHHEGL